MDAIGANTLTYNWNTTNFATLLTSDRDAVLAFRATGALPLDYLLDVPTPASTAASEVGRAYFAGLSDPTLVRAVQYNALYQAFRLGHMLRSADSLLPTAASLPSTDTITSAAAVDATIAMVTAFARASDEVLQKVTEREFELAAARDPSIRPDSKAAVIEMVLAARHSALFEGASSDSLRVIAEHWMSPSGVTTPDETIQVTICKALRPFMQQLVDIARWRAAYQKEHAEPTDRWEHTSSWVMSTHEMLLGGHNWDFDYKLEEQPKNARRWQAVLQSDRQPIAAHVIGGWSSTSRPVDRAILRAYGASQDLDVVRLVRDEAHYSLSFSDRLQELPAATLADAYDGFTDVLRTQDAKKPVHIHLEGFSDEQVRVFRDRVDRFSETNARDIEVFASDDKLTPQQAKELTRKQEFKAVAVEHVEPSMLAPNVVAATLTGSKGKLRRLIATISVKFRDGVTEPVRARVKQIIEAACAKLDFTGSWKQLAGRLRRDLKAALRRENIDGGTAEIANEQRSTYLVELAPVTASGRI